MRVLVCGGRHYKNRAAVAAALERLSDPDETNMLGKNPITVITGGCPTGADAHAIDWAVCNWSPFEEFRADWTKYGLAAGPIRNQKMADEARADLVLAFPGGTGTADMVRRAESAGIPVIKYA